MLIEGKKQFKSVESMAGPVNFYLYVYMSLWHRSCVCLSLRKQTEALTGLLTGMAMTVAWKLFYSWTKQDRKWWSIKDEVTHWFYYGGTLWAYIEKYQK